MRSVGKIALGVFIGNVMFALVAWAIVAITMHHAIAQMQAVPTVPEEQMQGDLNQAANDAMADLNSALQDAGH